jgi:hypothetical protein
MATMPLARRARAPIGLVCAALAAGAGPVRAAPARGLDALGPLEREAAVQALATRGLVVDPAPDGKRIGQIHVANQEVFSERDRFLQWFNLFHRTTREDVVRREVLLRPGDPYDQAIVDETVRHLQDPDLSSLVVVLPVTSGRPGEVDLLIVTRDVWSLRFNTDFQLLQGQLIYLAASLSENNLLGLRKRVSVDLTMNLGSVAVGPTYVDPNVRGTRLSFSSAVRLLYGREDGEFEGTSSATSLSYPLYSLASRWGAAIDVGHANQLVRRFRGTALREVSLAPGLTRDQAIDGGQPPTATWLYRSQVFTASAGVTRQFGKRVSQRLTLGHGLTIQRPDFVDGFSPDPALRARFAALVFPRSERISAPSLGYSLFTPRYRTYRDLDTYDLSEHVRLGPSFGTSVGYAARALGSEREFANLSASAGWAFDVAGGFQRVSAGASGRLEDAAFVDQTFSAGAYAATPLLGRTVRVVGALSGSVLRRDTGNRLYSLGGDSGLRGYAVGDFSGKAQALGHLEVRSVAAPVASLRVGGLVFWDVGHAAPRLEDLSPRHDFGAGLRVLIPQFNAYVLRVDWAFPTHDTFDPVTRRAVTRAGWPGRVSAGFRQVF